MILNNIKNMKKAHGFTIVELLVVIVVIGILATITIVSYAGITQKANTTKAQTNAQSAQSVAEVFNADKGYYPYYTTDFLVSEITKLPAAVVFDDTLDANNGDTAIWYQYCGTVDAPTAGTGALGGRIVYYNFSDPEATDNVFYVGSGTEGAGTATCHLFVTAVAEP